MVNPNVGDAEMIYAHINGIYLLRSRAIRKAILHNLDERLLIRSVQRHFTRPKF